jgi:hypothetical protein
MRRPEEGMRRVKPMDVKGAQALADRIAEVAKNVVASPAGSAGGEDVRRSLARGSLAEQASLEPASAVNKTA